MEFWGAVIGIIGGLIGAIGGTVGIVAGIRSFRRETWRKIEEQNDYNFLAAFMKTQLEVGNRMGQICLDSIQIEPESTEWQRAERLVERGILERGPNGRGYRLKGFYQLGP